jgi:arylsulfatase A-like enzyme
MNTSVVHGNPLPDVTTPLEKKAPGTAIIFIIDGCRTDTLYKAIEGGSMPKLRNFMEETGYTRYDNCFTVFPSVTITCHASIVTGTYPGSHGIAGNNWFIRKKWAHGNGKKLYEATREYVKRSWIHPFSDPGLANGFFSGDFFGIADSDLYHRVRTAYEGYGDLVSAGSEGTGSMTIFEMITRGADERKYIDLDDIPALRGRLLGIINWIKSKFTGKFYLDFPNNALDVRAFEELLEELGKRERPGLFVVWLPGMDGFSHKNGAGRQHEYFKDKEEWIEFFTGDLDRKFGKLRKKLEKRGLLDDVLIAITADHGQYDCSDRLGISDEMLYHYLKYDPDARRDEKFPLTPYGKVDQDCTDATVVVMGNGGACYIYLRGEDGWGEPPALSRMEKFLKPLENFTAVDKLFVRYSDAEYRLWEKGGYKDIDSLDMEEYPFAKERVDNLSNTLRGGDIVISARKPFYFASDSMRGEHGSLHMEDSHVPLLFINGNLKDKKHVEEYARTIDISPTIAESMGFLEELKKPGSPKDKLHWILDELERILSSSLFRKGPEKALGMLGRSGLRSRFERNWNVYETDLKENFNAKLENFRKRGLITDKDHSELAARYEKIKAAAGEPA